MKTIIAIIVGTIFFPIIMEKVIDILDPALLGGIKIYFQISTYALGGVVGATVYLIYNEFKINEKLIDLKKSILQIKESKGMQPEKFDGLSDEIITVKPNDDKEDEK